jgi:membrane protein
LPNRAEIFLKFYQFLIRMIKKSRDVNIHRLSCELAFGSMMALFPFLVVLVSSLLVFQNPKAVQFLMNISSELFPRSIYQPIDSSIHSLIRSYNRNALFLSIGISIFASIALFNTLIQLIHVISPLEERIPNFRRRMLIPFRLYGLVVAYLVFVGFLIYQGYLWEKELFISTRFKWIISLNKPIGFVLGFFALFFLLSILYSYSYHFHRKWKDVFWGALFFSILWLPVSSIFSLFLSSQTKTVYYQAYGFIAKIAGMVFWMYLNSFLFLMGEIFNSTLRSWVPNEESQNKLS